MTESATQYGSVYPLPYHDVERQRLRTQHEGLVGIMHNNPIHAPISTLNPEKIVDVGCGINADMTMYFAKRFPEAQIYGVDLAPIDIPKEHIPPNVVFIQGNITDLVKTDPRLASGTVDFLYSRLLGAGMQNWREYISVVASLLSPGGMTEMHDFAGTDFMQGDTEVAFGQSKWHPYLVENMTKKMGVDLRVFDKADVIMKDLGVEDTHVKQYRLNWGEAKDESERAWVEEGRANWFAAIEMVVTALVKGEEPAVREEILRDLHEQTAPPKEGVWFPFYVAWGRKPL